MNETAPQALVDGHVHVWDTRRLRYPWLEANPQLPGTVLPPHAAQPVTAVFVQADAAPQQALEEVRWVESLGWRALGAIVAYAPEHSGAAVGSHLAVLRDGHPKVRGVRRLLQGEQSGCLDPAAYEAGLRAVARAELVFEATVRFEQIGEFAAIHAAVPEVVVVWDHVGNPPLDDGLDSDAGRLWLAGIRAAAAHPLGVVKLSGAAASDGRGSDFLLAAIEAFGVDRVLVGSDRPLSVPVSDSAYAQWAANAGAGLGLDHGELEHVRAVTAQRVYRLAND